MSFFPNVRGVGYAVFVNNKYQYSAMITTRKRCVNERYLERIKKLLLQYRPRVIVLEEYRKNRGSIKTERIRLLIKAIAELGRKNSITIIAYKRRSVRDVFSFYNVMKKYDIARLICLWIPKLERHIYKERNAHMEPYSSAIFDAVSLILTHIYLNG